MRSQMRSQKRAQQASKPAPRQAKARTTQRRALSTSRQAKAQQRQQKIDQHKLQNQQYYQHRLAQAPPQTFTITVAPPKRAVHTAASQRSLAPRKPTKSITITQQPSQSIKQQQQQQRQLTTAAKAKAPKPLTSAQIRAQFAAIPILATPTGMVSAIPSTPEPVLTNATRNLTTTNHTSALVQRVTNGLTPITLPHHSNIASSPLDTVPFFMPVRNMAMQKPKEGGKNSKDAKDKKKAGGFEVDPGEEALASAGDVKKNIRNWLEQIIQSKPEITPMPQAAIDNEELFVKECQARFAQRLDERTRFETAKIIIKQRAIAQLPGELKTSSLKHDPTLWSMRVMTPFSDPPRKRWLLEHYGIPYKASQQEIDEEDFLKKKYARL